MGVHHITNSSHYDQLKGHVEKYVWLVKSLSSKTNETCENPMELLCTRANRSDQAMSHGKRMQAGRAASSRPQAEVVMSNNKNHVKATSNLLPLGTNEMHKTRPSKVWYIRIVTGILQNSGSYIITAPD